MPEAKPNRTAKRAVLIILKLAVTAGILFLLFRNGEWERFVAAASTLSLVWLLPAALVKAAGIFSSILRWRWLLRGQDLEVPLRHLVGSFLVGRFIGIVVPGTLGLDGYRAYDIARHAKAPARSIAVIIVEKVIGFFALGLLVLATLPGGRRIVGDHTVIVLALVFVLPVGLALYILLRPGAVEKINARLTPRAFGLRDKIAKAAQAAGAYAHRRGSLFAAMGFGILVHLATASMYIFTSRAVGADVTVADILFVAPLMIVATTVPISFSGFGVREFTFAALLAAIAVPGAEAKLIGTLGFVSGEIFSVLGGFVFLARGRAYAPQIAELRTGVRAGDLAADRDDTADEAGPGVMVARAGEEGT